jgi:trimethylamine---corrinoid protein Co-methyltransferase
MSAHPVSSLAGVATLYSRYQQRSTPLFSGAGFGPLKTGAPQFPPPLVLAARRVWPTYNHALVGNAGANLLYESAGMVASLLGFSMEQLIIDNDIIGAIQRTIRGIDVSEDALSLDAIRETCLGGPNHFLGSAQTLARMQTEYLYPSVGDRTSPKEWEEKSRPNALQKATRKLESILGTHYPTHVPQYIDEKIRAKFPVRLPRELMEWG